MNASLSDITSRIGALTTVCRALRVLRFSLEWPPDHDGRPPRPEYVRAFEERHGAAPASALRVLQEYRPLP